MRLCISYMQDLIQLRCGPIRLSPYLTFSIITCFSTAALRTILHGIFQQIAISSKV
jgi:hypothetical protein